MLSDVKNKNSLMAVLVGLFGFVISLLYSLTPLIYYSAEEVNKIIDNVGADILRTGVYSSFSAFIFCSISYLIWVKFKDLFSVSKVDKKGIAMILGVGVLCPILITVLDFLIYFDESPVFNTFVITGLDTLSKVFYNGVLEDIWVRLGFLPLIIYSFFKVFGLKEEEISEKYYKYGLIFVTLLMFVLQLDTVLTSYVFTAGILLRVILLTLIPQFIYNVLFLKYGFKYAVIAHTLFIVMFFLVCPYFIDAVLLAGI